MTEYINRISLVGLTGPAGCGKDTVADLLERHHHFAKIALADPLKRGLEAMFGWQRHQWLNRNWKEAVDPDLGFSPRKAMQTLGTEWGRGMNDELWIKVCTRQTKKLMDMSMLHQYNGVVVSDIRFENEADMIRQQGGVVIHLTRQNIANVRHHTSENGIEFDRKDFLVHNNGPIDDTMTRIRWTLGLV